MRNIWKKKEDEESKEGEQILPKSISIMLRPLLGCGQLPIMA